MAGLTTLSDSEYESQSGADSSDPTAALGLPGADDSEEESEAPFDAGGDIDFINIMPAPLQHDAIAELDDNDTELWLMRIPRHESIHKSLVGSEMRVMDENDKEAAVGRLAGELRGSYSYRDHGPVCDVGRRAAFTAGAENGENYVQVAKPFAKFVSVTFESSLMGLGNIEAPPRVYPEPPRDQKLKYFPIGSSRSDLPLMPSRTVALSPKRLKPGSPGSFGSTEGERLLSNKIRRKKEVEESPRKPKSPLEPLHNKEALVGNGYPRDTPRKEGGMMLATDSPAVTPVVKESRRKSSSKRAVSAGLESLQRSTHKEESAIAEETPRVSPGKKKKAVKHSGQKSLRRKRPKDVTNTDHNVEANGGIKVKVEKDTMEVDYPSEQIVKQEGVLSEMLESPVVDKISSKKKKRDKKSKRLDAEKSSGGISKKKKRRSVKEEAV